MRRIIPGHVRAHTLYLTVLVMAVSIGTARHWRPPLGLALVLFGAFLGDQATHLAQMDHSAPPPTWIERQMQQRRWVFVALGNVIAIAGVILAMT